MKTRVTAVIETVTASARSETGMKARDVITITETGTIVIAIETVAIVIVIEIVAAGIAVSASTVTGIIAGAVPVCVSKTKMATFTAGITEDLRNGRRFARGRWPRPSRLSIHLSSRAGLIGKPHRGGFRAPYNVQFRCESFRMSRSLQQKQTRHHGYGI
jgi:hypothetical protein